MKNKVVKKILAVALCVSMLFVNAPAVKAADEGDFSSVTIFGNTTAAITGDGNLYMWGDNASGQIGNGATKTQYKPVKVMSNVKEFKINEEYGHYNICAAVTKKGDLYMWGDDIYGMLTYDCTEKSRLFPKKIMSNVATVEIEFGVVAALTKSGDLYMWGLETTHTLKKEYDYDANGTFYNTRYKPAKVMSNVVSVSLRDSEGVAAITKDGSLYMWGNNNEGQVGNGTFVDQNDPVKVLSNVASVELAANNSAAITKNGDLYVWGYNYYGQVGNNTTTLLDENKPVKVLSNVKDVEIGYADGEYCAALTKAGDLYTWGNYYHGNLGTGKNKDEYKPVKIISDIRSFKTNGGCVSAITTNEDLYVWGGNSWYEISYTPEKIMENVAYADVSNNYYGGNAVITTNGDLFVWGDNDYGQVGNGEVCDDILEPVKVLTDVLAVSLESSRSAAIREDGCLYAWGYNYYGQIGDGTRIDRYTPVNVLTGVQFPTDEIEIKNENVERIFGENRYETSYAIADELKEIYGVEKFETVVLANGKNFPDALAGSYLAGEKDAPILMANEKKADSLQAYVEENVEEGGTVYVLGGDAAVPESVVSGLEEDFEVVRIAGDNRYETNLLILEEVGASEDEILVCTGKDFADSLSASATGMPILLVNNKGLTDDQKEFLEENQGKHYYIIGGTSAVSQEMEEAIETYGTTERISGENRYETSVKVAEKFFEEPTEAVITYGKNFPDGLCGGPLAMSMNAPLILTTVNKAGAAEAYVTEKGIVGGKVLGGNTLISNGAANVIF